MRSKKENQLLTVALLAVVILAGDRLVWRPLAEDWRARDTKIVELDQINEAINSIRNGYQGKILIKFNK